jgi:hypothetical protein
MPIDRDLYFTAVREDPFPGSLTQNQVDGMNAILDAWESVFAGGDLRWLAYALATTYHETSATMQPIEEYGKGEGMAYGEPDKTTKQVYYGRGFVQLTWRDNYARADRELGLEGDMSCEWHAENALRLDVAAACLFEGMVEGWYRTHDDGGPETLGRYFNDDVDDPFEAREIINGDKTKCPSWASGASIGELIASYHREFLMALEKAYVEDPEDEPSPGRRLLAEARARRSRG